MLLRVPLVRTEVSEECFASINRVKRIVTLMMEAISCSETLVLTKAPQRHNPEEGIPHTFFPHNIIDSFLCVTPRTMGADIK
jgi:hypothetical protein